jgi:hypothetical protein
MLGLYNGLIMEKPLSASIRSQLWLYFLSVFLPPFGLGLTIRYLRSDEDGFKRIGLVSLILTVVALMVAVWGTIALSVNLNQQINQQLGNYEGLGL